MVLFPLAAQLPAPPQDSKFTVHETTGIRVVFAGFPCRAAAARRRAREAGVAARRRPQGDPRQHHGGLGGPGARRAGPGVFGSRTCSSTASIRRSRERQGAPTTAGWAPGPDGIMSKAASGSRSRGLAGAGPLSQGRRDHRGDPGDVQGRRRRGQSAGAGVGPGVPAGARQSAEPPLSRSLGDVTPTGLTRCMRSSTASKCPRRLNASRYANARVDTPSSRRGAV